MGVHGQFRRMRVTAGGTYLASFLSLNKVAEYDTNFNQVWSYDIPSPWAAIRLRNGNTLITDERDRLTREVNPEGQTVWEFKLATDLPPGLDFPGSQSCVRLANGNTVLLLGGRCRQRLSTHRSHPGQESRLGAQGLDQPRPRHRRPDAGRPRHPRNSRRLPAMMSSCPSGRRGLRKCVTRPSLWGIIRAWQKMKIEIH